MPIEVKCDKCQATLRAPDSTAGKRIKCPRCSNILLVESIDEDPEVDKEHATHGMIFVPAERQTTSHRPAQKQKPKSDDRQSLQSTYIVAGNSRREIKLLAIGLVFTVILTGVATTGYMLGRSLPDSDKAIVSNNHVEDSTIVQPREIRIENVPAPQNTPTANSGKTPENSVVTTEPPGNSNKADTVEPVRPPTSVQPAASTVSVQSPVTFEPLLLDEPATSFTMSEDGRFVIMSHQAAGLVSIYDVMADKVTHVIHTDSPRALLSRGDQLFVGNFGEGKISVFSASNAWKLQNEIKVTKPKIVFMSAACQQNFAGEILVTCHGEGGQASYQDSTIFLVDVQRDRCKEVSRQALASVSFDGKTALTQSSFNLSPSGGLRVYSYDEFVAGDPEPIFQGGIQQTPFVYQSYSGSYWLSENMVFGGAPIALVHEKLGQIVIPDTMQKLIYVMDEEVIAHVI